VAGKRNEEQRRLDNERRQERHRRQAEERAREREASPPATPKAILRLERKVGCDGVARALAIVGRWRAACLKAGAPTNDQDCLVYREALEMIALGLADEVPAPPREAARSYAPLYDNPDG
jgi:hypothetical protein